MRVCMHIYLRMNRSRRECENETDATIHTETDLVGFHTVKKTEIRSSKSRIGTLFSVHSFVRSFVRSFIRSFVQSFVHSLFR